MRPHMEAPKRPILKFIHHHIGFTAYICTRMFLHIVSKLTVALVGITILLAALSFDNHALSLKNGSRTTHILLALSGIIVVCVVVLEIANCFPSKNR